MKEHKHWVDIKKYIPNFEIFGFHTKRKIKIKLKDDIEAETKYLGYGEFGDIGKTITKDVVFWECDVEGCGII